MPQLHQLKNGRERQGAWQGPPSGRIEHYKVTHRCQSFYMPVNRPMTVSKMFSWAHQRMRKVQCYVLWVEMCCTMLPCVSSLWPQGLDPTRSLHPWDFPGQNTEWVATSFSTSPASPAFAVEFFTRVPPGKPQGWNMAPHDKKVHAKVWAWGHACDLSQKWSPGRCNQVKMMPLGWALVWYNSVIRRGGSHLKGQTRGECHVSLGRRGMGQLEAKSQWKRRKKSLSCVWFPCYLPHVGVCYIWRMALSPIFLPEFCFFQKSFLNGIFFLLFFHDGKKTFKRNHSDVEWQWRLSVCACLCV